MTQPSNFSQTLLITPALPGPQGAAGAVTSTNTAGTGTGLAAGPSVIQFYSTADYSGGTSHTRSDNQVPIQLAINAGAGDPGRRTVRIPRDPTPPYPGNNTLTITAPIEIVGVNQLTFEGENEWVTLRALGFYGPCLFAGPPTTAPTPIQDGTSGFWGFSLSSGAWLPIGMSGTTQLDGLTAFTAEYWLQATLGTSNGNFISSDGQRGFSESVTTALQLGVTSQNKVLVRITTSVTGVSTYTSTAALPNGVRTKVEMAFDQATTAVRIYINGVYDGAISLSAGETITQGHEDFILNGGGGCQWPLMGGRGVATPVAGATIYSIRLSNIARHTTSSNYTPETSQLTADANTMLLINFNPNTTVGNPAFGTCATSAAGFCSGAFALINAQGINGPVYIPWQTGNAAQMAQLEMKNITFLCVGTGGPWLQSCPVSRLRRIGLQGNGPAGLVMYGNCYNSEIHGLDIAWGNVVGNFLNQKQGAFYYFAGGSNSFSDIQIAGGTYGIILANFSGHIYGNSYILPQGRGGAVIKGFGADCVTTWDNCFVGDETKLQTDFGVMLIGQAGDTAYNIGASTVNVTQGSSTVVGVNTTWTIHGGPTAGLYVTFSSQLGVYYPVQSVTDDTHLVLGIPGGVAIPYSGTTTSGAIIKVPHGGGSGLHTIFNGGTPQLTSSGAPLFLIDGGTCHKINCETWQALGNSGVVCKFLKDADDGVYILGTQNTIFSNGTTIPWMPENGQTGQGRLYVESLRQGRLVKYPCPDTAVYNIPITVALSSSLAPAGILTATRIHLLPLIAGLVWDVDLTFQGGSAQAVTFQCTSNGTSGTGASITIAANKHARFACYDTNIGLERLTPDT